MRTQPDSSMQCFAIEGACMHALARCQDALEILNPRVSWSIRRKKCNESYVANVTNAFVTHTLCLMSNKRKKKCNERKVSVSSQDAQELLKELNPKP